VTKKSSNSFPADPAIGNIDLSIAEAKYILGMAPDAVAMMWFDAYAGATPSARRRMIEQVIFAQRQTRICVDVFGP